MAGEDIWGLVLRLAGEDILAAVLRLVGEDIWMAILGLAGVVPALRPHICSPLCSGSRGRSGEL